MATTIASNRLAPPTDSAGNGRMRPKTRCSLCPFPMEPARVRGRAHLDDDDAWQVDVRLLHRTGSHAWIRRAALLSRGRVVLRAVDEPSRPRLAEPLIDKLPERAARAVVAWLLGHDPAVEPSKDV